MELKYIGKYAPTYGTEHSAGLDLYCDLDEDIVIKPKEIKGFSLNIKVEIPEGYFGALYPRSSTGVKKNLMLVNTIGIIDSDYRGEIQIHFYNFGDKEIVIKDKDRLVQLIITPYQKVDLVKTDNLCETVRGEGGIGSTDAKKNII
jgi:dUTP diphosphatase